MDDPMHAMNPLKRQQEDTRHKSTAKKQCKSLLSQATSELVKPWDNNGGQLPHNKMREAI